MTLSVKKFEPHDKYSDYKPSKEEETKISFVRGRFKQMQQGRSIVDKDWDTYQAMIEAIYEPYPDERSSSVVPLASAMIELYVAEALKLETIYQFKGETSKQATNAKALEYAWKYDYRKNNRKKEFIRNEYITAGFGTSVLYTGFETYEIEQKDPIVGDDMEFRFETVKFKKEKILVKNVDIRNFYIDNHAITDIEEAADCIYKQWISYDKFKQYSSNPFYKNTDKVRPKEYSNEYHTFVTQEEETKQGDFVELMHYWNVEKDVYVVIANGVLVREHPMISTIGGEKALPFVVRNLGHKSYSIYGRGLCEALLMFNSEVNNLRELLMDAIRRSNSQVLALGNGLTFDGRTFSYDNEIMTFDGNLAGNFQQLSGNAPNQAIFSYLDRIYKDIAVFVGLDIQNIIGEPQQTAFQTEVQREASQKRINIWLKNRDMAFERFANLYKDLLQKYFPRKTAEGLYPQIEIEGEQLVGKGDKQKFTKKKGKSIFEATPEMLRGQIYIDVYTNVNAPTINVVDRQQKLDFLQTVGSLSQGYALAQQSGVDMDAILPLKETLREMASSYNLKPQVGGGDVEIQEELKKLQNDLKQMMGTPGGGSGGGGLGGGLGGQQGMGQEGQQEPLQPNAQTPGRMNL